VFELSHKDDDRNDPIVIAEESDEGVSSCNSYKASAPHLSPEIANEVIPSNSGPWINFASSRRMPRAGVRDREEAWAEQGHHAGRATANRSWRRRGRRADHDRWTSSTTTEALAGPRQGASSLDKQAYRDLELTTQALGPARPRNSAGSKPTTLTWLRENRASQQSGLEQH